MKEEKEWEVEQFDTMEEIDKELERLNAQMPKSWGEFDSELAAKINLLYRWKMSYEQRRYLAVCDRLEALQKSESARG